MSGRQSVFGTMHFAQGRAIFEDHGFPVHYYVQGRDEFAALEWDHIRLLYSSPSHMDADGQRHAGWRKG